MIAVVGALLTLVYGVADVPTKSVDCYGCELCRATREQVVYFSIARHSSVHETEFSRYYRKNVESRHQHVWGWCCGRWWSCRSGRIADGMNTVQHLKMNTELAIVRSLPDRRARKAFCSRFCIPDTRPDMWREVCTACAALNAAYEEKPNRRDWPTLVRRVGLYPKPTHLH